MTGSTGRLRRVTAAVLDQGVLSAANLALNLLLARRAGPDEFGAYATAFSAFILVAGLHNGLVRDPMLVLGAPLPEDERRRLIGAEVLLHGVLTLALALVVTLGVLASGLGAGGGGALERAVVAAAVATPGILLHWLGRQAAYLMGRPRVAAEGAGLYSALAALGALGLLGLGELSAWGLLGIQGIAGLAAGGFSVARLGVRWEDLGRRSARATLREHGQEQWRYGRWVVGAAVVDWGATAAYAPLLAAMVSLPAAGAFRAAEQVFLPLTRLQQAVVLLVLPELSRRWAARGAAGLRRPGWLLVLGSVAAAMVWAAAPVAIPEATLSFLFGPQFAEYTPLVPWIALAVVVNAGRLALEAVARAAKASSSLFAAQAVAALVVVGLARPVLAEYGALGAAYLAVGAALAGAAVLLLVMSLVGLGPQEHSRGGTD